MENGGECSCDKGLGLRHYLQFSSINENDFFDIKRIVKLPNRLHLYSAFLTTSHSKRFTIANIIPFMHTFTPLLMQRKQLKLYARFLV